MCVCARACVCVGDKAQNIRKNIYLVRVKSKGYESSHENEWFESGPKNQENMLHDLNQPFLWFESSRFVIQIKITEPKSKICSQTFIQVKHLHDSNQTSRTRVMLWCDLNQTPKSKILFFWTIVNLSKKIMWFESDLH